MPRLLDNLLLRSSLALNKHVGCLFIGPWLSVFTGLRISLKSWSWWVEAKMQLLTLSMTDASALCKEKFVRVWKTNRTTCSVLRCEHWLKCSLLEWPSLQVSESWPPTLSRYIFHFQIQRLYSGYLVTREISVLMCVWILSLMRTVSLHVFISDQLDVWLYQTNSRWQRTIKKQNAML